MTNESKTEAIVREHFSQFSESVFTEEKNSDNPRINKLLKNASKSGNGKGYPDFIISYQTNLSLIIVIECKASISKHESEKRDEYSKFAVDGVLLYASYLSKEFDVLAIAVSGETEKSLKVSHFLHLRGGQKATQIFGDKFLPVCDYLSGYLQSPEKSKQDHNSLLNFTSKLNAKLHVQKIRESERGLLISAILIALEDDVFKKSYASKKTAKTLATFLVQTVSDELESANITGEKLANLNTHFEFIKRDTSLSKKSNVLREIVDEIDENINTFIKTYKYFDVLGQLYIEFLRYANSDKGLGIVLTPPHITEFFADLAQVNKDSVAYDNCTGTGGFLISAMKKMITDAKGDKSKINDIKTNQLIGTEYQSHIFALVVSNMYIHQDGKTSIINDDCFNDEVIKEVKAKNPTVGFLNPPYKSDKEKDIDELEFILNNLECLAEGGTCVAIVPMQSALATTGKVLELKKKLLDNHTLEAVLSMPNELFFNSKVNVVSCSMVFTAHKPHPNNKETYFGYYKDDGFVKRKKKGRIDVYGNWDGIKEKWLSNFINRKGEPGFSVNQIVKADEEWVAEAYMETDYSNLKDENFRDTILDYAIFLYKNEILSKDRMQKNRMSNSKINLEINTWEYFELGKLFTIEGTKTTRLLKLKEHGAGKYPYVTTQATDNGTKGFFNFFTEGGGVLTIDSAVAGYCSYQSLCFSTSDHVEKLTSGLKMNKYHAMFLTTILNLDQYRYNYGRKCSQERMRKTKIKLPSKRIGDAMQPDYDYMENYIKSIAYSSHI